MKNTEYSRLLTISTHYFDPSRAMRLMLDLIKSKEKYTKKILQRIYLQRLTERGLGTTGVEMMDRKVVMNDSRRDERTIVRMMNRKIKDAISEEKIARFENLSSRRLYRDQIVQGDFGNEAFECLASEIVERMWHVKMNQIKKSVKEKMDMYKRNKFVNDVNGIRIGDDQLTEQENQGCY